MAAADCAAICTDYSPLKDEDDSVTESTVDTITYVTSEVMRKKASLFSISANLVMSGLGAGILSLPWAMAGASILPSVFTTLVVMALNAGTIMILVLAAERHQVFDLGALLSYLPGGIGPFAQVFNNALTWISVYLTLVGYIVVMADSLQPLATSALGLDSADMSFWTLRAPLLGASGIIVLPICFVDQERLAVTSIVGICVTVYLFIVVSTLFAQEGVAPECCIASGGIHEGTLTMFSTVMQCSIVQMCILPMYEELENRTPKRFGVAVGAAFSFLAVLFASFSAVAYTVFGPGVQSNVMMDLPHDFFGNAARLGMTLVMVAVFPIMMLSMVTPVRHWEETSGRESGYLTNACCVVIVAASCVGAAFVGKLGDLNAMNGSAQVSFFIGIAPGLTGIYLMGRTGATWKSAMYALVLFSVAFSILGAIFTDNNVMEIAKTCLLST